MIADTHERPAGGPPGGAADAPPEVSVVMPCLDEARTLESCIRKAQGAFRAEGVRGEVIVADNGSTDGSQALAERLGARVVHVRARGYGAALAAGIAEARGRYVIMGDSDDSYDFGNLGPFIAKLREGYDLVMGNRFRGGILRGAMPTSHRLLGNPALTAVGRLFFRSRCGDFYCGQRGFRRDAVVALDLQTRGMEYALEMLVKATMMGLKIGEVPVTLSPDGRDRAPHLRTWRDGWRSLRFLLVYSPRWLFLYPGVVLMALGLAAGAWLLAGGRRVGPLRLDIHTLVYCSAAIAVGFQLAAFALFGKILAIATGLHPRNPRVERLLAGRAVEAGLLIGVGLLVAGAGGSAFAVARWADARFGDLDPFRMMRIIVPAALSLTLGLQVAFPSFYLTLLQMHSRKLQGADS